MKSVLVSTLSLSLSLAGLSQVATAQEVIPGGISTNADGSYVTSTAGVNPTANGGGGTIIYGDITTGPGYTVIGPPSVVQSEPAPAAEAAPAEPAPVEPNGSAPATEAVATATDQDADNLADELEWAQGLDPSNPDTDADGVADGDELAIYGTDPLAADTDGDGATDGAELFATHTDPLVWDTTASEASPQTVAQQAAPAPVQIVGEPGRVVTRGQETTEILTASDGDAAALGSGNASAAPGTVTRDGVTIPGTSLLGPDGIYRVTEISPPVVSVSENTPPIVTAPPPVTETAPVVEETTSEPVAAEAAPASATDLDADNYDDALELEIGLDPTNPDTDGDGVADGDEVTIYGTDPFAWDTDGDGLSDGEELFATQTDPLAWDTNGDGLGDAEPLSTGSPETAETAGGA